MSLKTCHKLRRTRYYVIFVVGISDPGKKIFTKLPDPGKNIYEAAVG